MRTTRSVGRSLRPCVHTVQTSDGRRQDDDGGGGGGTGSGVATTETVVDAAVMPVMDRATAGACVAPARCATPQPTSHTHEPQPQDDTIRYEMLF